MINIERCNVCPRECGINRRNEIGACKSSADIKIAKAFLHKWEEPCISGENGSGTIFFSNCNLHCVYCQNYKISHEGYGKVISIDRLAEIFLELQRKKAHNINLVTPTHYIPQIREAIILSKKCGLTIPVIYNTNSYERVEALKLLEGLVDIYLPDIKYFDDKYGKKYSKVDGYFKTASKAVLEMYRQVGNPVFNEEGLLVKGMMIRHLMLPGLLFDSKKIIDWVLENLPREIYLNIMCQYTPLFRAHQYSEINRRINKNHYEGLIDYAISKGLENGFFQEFESATEEYVPNFDLEGV
ncbi:iron-sulfur protein [Fervidicella metallireducens AeB]|uniref:Iron-sulfur protein n=1 Tax=Fervidicella metallireducens AeB TaxID=1403537 RepID=A0A017RX64_9CLOT|nr:radical SAM protein [Fervidicella metallireducens]EYE88505.1 iron-sulfur protein [Fervidicella metallireducens AeB]